MTPPNPASQPHLQIFNHLRASGNENSFTCFSLLPPEIRSQIWGHALKRERLIKIYFQKNYSFSEERPKPDGEIPRYQIMIDGRKTVSKLLRVNQESRQAALRFYRVKIPCKISPVPDDDYVYEALGLATKAQPGVLYYNPEWDFLEIASESWRADDLFDLAYHLKKTYDPRHVGLLNLAIGGVNSLSSTGLQYVDPKEVDPQVRQVFQETLAQLREVFFITRTKAGRRILGSASGIPVADPHKCIFNRSFPITTVTPIFERLQRDTRSISEDLKQTHVGDGPMRMAYYWQSMLDIWGVSASHITYQFILAFEPSGPSLEIQDRESASRWLQVEEDEWTGKWRLDDEIKNGCWAKRSLGTESEPYYEMVGALDGENRYEDLDKAVKPAFGFWIFPLRLFGKIPSSEEECNEVDSKQTLDLSDHWPGLGISLF
ncbi:hypothetical protein P170DRAFT_435525 [Aspergillus steynii IBT 23096]|uniref:2EXR domain-containing protein n=1 Tax=Aspergillus steynii IBT 23096 TaxID=1392250 RepID=A0A2I2GBS2_9EURO|nr:uncharacterized protein P170DRAFT_435525 [Aspergillus steynii IBT 23096]PLB50323.1 hypothetical protein P170DRAFT_435525 [Aspergillus steynii IBT 23096]